MLTSGTSVQILGDDDHAESVKEEDDPPKQQALKGHDDIISDAPSHFPSLVNTYDGSLSQETGQPPVTLHIVKVETANEVSYGRLEKFIILLYSSSKWLLHGL